MTLLSSVRDDDAASDAFAALATLVTCTPSAPVTLSQLGRLIELTGAPTAVSRMAGVNGVEEDFDILVGAARCLGILLNNVDSSALEAEQIGLLAMGLATKIDALSMVVLTMLRNGGSD